MEKKLKCVTFTFQDGSTKVLRGQELEDWETICALQSDYLLPGDSDHILAVGYGGLVRGFVPPTAIGEVWQQRR